MDPGSTVVQEVGPSPRERGVRAASPGQSNLCLKRQEAYIRGQGIHLTDMMKPGTVAIVDIAPMLRYETLTRRLMLITALVLPTVGCHSTHHEGVIPAGPSITSRVITTGELPSEFDTARTYHYQLPSSVIG